jgi:hypothetical protein
MNNGNISILLEEAEGNIEQMGYTVAVSHENEQM